MVICMYAIGITLFPLVNQMATVPGSIHWNLGSWHNPCLGGVTAFTQVLPSVAGIAFLPDALKS